MLQNVALKTHWANQLQRNLKDSNFHSYNPFPSLPQFLATKQNKKQKKEEERKSLLPLGKCCWCRRWAYKSCPPLHPQLWHTLWTWTHSSPPNSSTTKTLIQIVAEGFLNPPQPKHVDTTNRGETERERNRGIWKERLGRLGLKSQLLPAIIIWYYYCVPKWVNDSIPGPISKFSTLSFYPSNSAIKTLFRVSFISRYPFEKSKITHTGLFLFFFF